MIEHVMYILDLCMNLIFDLKVNTVISAYDIGVLASLRKKPVFEQKLNVLHSVFEKKSL